MGEDEEVMGDVYVGDDPLVLRLIGERDEAIYMRAHLKAENERLVESLNEYRIAVDERNATIRRLEAGVERLRTILRHVRSLLDQVTTFDAGGA